MDIITSIIASSHALLDADSAVYPLNALQGGIVRELTKIIDEFTGFVQPKELIYDCF